MPTWLSPYSLVLVTHENRRKADLAPGLQDNGASWQRDFALVHEQVRQRQRPASDAQGNARLIEVDCPPARVRAEERLELTRNSGRERERSGGRVPLHPA